MENEHFISMIESCSTSAFGDVAKNGRSKTDIKKYSPSFTLHEYSFKSCLVIGLNWIPKRNSINQKNDLYKYYL